MKYVEYVMLAATVAASFALLGLGARIWMDVLSEWRKRGQDSDADL